MATICSDNQRWPGAVIVSSTQDTFTGEKKVLLVVHPDFAHPVDFYATPDAEGKHRNVGNNAFWLEK